MAQISYNGLWKLLIDKKLKKIELKDLSGIGTTTLAKLGRNEPVSMDVLMKICDVLKCTSNEILEIIPDDIENMEHIKK
ncbi:DNA-binding Xre family transcriptional regulator [Hydrogenoanaerobacterium saccharovorans]|uniref:DNA-binding transcriptional regulator, XRE family n=1 Tax=Hydrogenoanaerobacterium saccharovorans TaxID=474960 RepID=A0A1H8D0C3_9FIRM|nr:helix-turn-helix transcriptional regulator [Hydrogenoanaerobacterium saccharovorans]RPF43416.1 DNA-binding Xre family transcriptional regulator [Hydrogenoanaerobacterium saccharovorans]SEN00686.1 DNA-binding transcriptional regulator, XRE family [Hydrogenoanaerobacterium saccharovorans]